MEKMKNNISDSESSLSAWTYNVCTCMCTYSLTYVHLGHSMRLHSASALQVGSRHVSQINPSFCFAGHRLRLRGSLFRRLDVLTNEYAMYRRPRERSPLSFRRIEAPPVGSSGSGPGFDERFLRIPRDHTLPMKGADTTQCAANSIRECEKNGFPRYWRTLMTSAGEKQRQMDGADKKREWKRGNEKL